MKRDGIWYVCRFEDGTYIGMDKKDGGFVKVHGLFNAYLAVEGELDDSAEILAEKWDYQILKVKVVGEEKITILADNFFK